MYKGVVICPIRRLNHQRGNLKQHEFCLDFRHKHRLRIYPEDIPEINDGFDFIDWLQEVVEEEFEGQEGLYWVGGKNKYWNCRMDNLFRIPVLYFEYEDGSLSLFKKRSYRKQWGKHKSTAKTYYAIQKFPELLDKL